VRPRAALITWLQLAFAPEFVSRLPEITVADTCSQAPDGVFGMRTQP